MTDLTTYLGMLREMGEWSSEDWPHLFDVSHLSLLESQARLPSSALWDTLAWKMPAPDKLVTPLQESPVARCLTLLAQSDGAFPHTVCALLDLMGMVNLAVPSQARPGKWDVHSLIPLQQQQGGQYNLGPFGRMIVEEHKPHSLKRMDVRRRVFLGTLQLRDKPEEQLRDYRNFMLVTAGAMYASKKHFNIVRKNRIKEGRVGVHFVPEIFHSGHHMSMLRVQRRKDKTRLRNPWDVIWNDAALPFGILDDD